MNDGAFWELGHVADGALQNELARLLANGSRTEARILAHLAAVEDRRLHLQAGSPSLFDYCCKRLGLSESEAFHRITAARLARRFPVIFGLIEQRAIHLTAVCLLRDYLTPNNHRELLAEASGKTKLQVQELLARRFPRPDVPSTIRKLPAPRELAAPRETTVGRTLAVAQGMPSVGESDVTPTMRLSPWIATAAANTASEPPASPAPSRSALPARAAAIEPRSATRYRIQLNASPELKEKLEQARDLLSHANPSGDLAAVIERALDLLLERTLRQRFAQTKRPRSGHRADRPGRENGSKSAENPKTVAGDIEHRSRRGHIANATKREIAARDGLGLHVRGQRRPALWRDPVHANSSRTAVGPPRRREPGQSSTLVRGPQPFASRAGFRPGADRDSNSKSARCAARCANRCFGKIAADRCGLVRRNTEPDFTAKAPKGAKIAYAVYPCARSTSSPEYPNCTYSVRGTAANIPSKTLPIAFIRHKPPPTAHPTPWRSSRLGGDLSLSSPSPLDAEGCAALRRSA